ncbi:uncharacterized protein B0I36DRAFT_368320 [Microdochium trichocladiopsis]|uniref:Uncharacterized protein n=1 Tax=Microdochium trichocladiopsis TaxID=1682393 RepID=A0A9P8XTY0_9PEZI|nr:uncharacterized protein B0I36DRAFT_368320 [Microdochium trichocladiopsis]KAH7018290.1 hypothetical protein B0I36DRAFT_368320 [Microdochium trichocladiopsis]
MAPLAKVLLGSAIALSITAYAAPVIIIDSRQLAGEGNFFDSLFTDTDNGVGYGTENAENNIAEMLGGSPASGGGSGGPPPKPNRRMAKRQGDKIANGAAAILHAVGANQQADLVQTDGDAVDGQLTDDATTLGAQIGSDKEDVLERTGDMVPNKMPTAPAAH